MGGKKGWITSLKGIWNTYIHSYRKLLRVWKYHETPTVKYAQAVVRKSMAELEWIRIQMSGKYWSDQQPKLLQIQAKIFCFIFENDFPNVIFWSSIITSDFLSEHPCLHSLFNSMLSFSQPNHNY